MHVPIIIFLFWCLGAFGIYKSGVSPWWIVVYGLGSMLLAGLAIYRANKKKA